LQPFNPDKTENYSLCLEKVSDYYRNKYNRVTALIDQKYLALAEEMGGSNELLAFKNKHLNKKLESLVRNTYSFNRLQIIDNHIVQVDEPVYREPRYRNGRAHFYAPCKFVGKMKIGTVLFNVLVMWVFTFILTVALYFDLFRKASGFFENWRLLRLTKKRDRIYENPMAFIKRRKE
jgi:hypothetical protein